MKETKFKVGDCITHDIDRPGLDEAVIYRVDDNNYYCRIICGKAIIPHTVEDNYKLKNKATYVRTKF